MTTLFDCVHHLDDLLKTTEIQDYDQSLNGLQLQNSGAVDRIAVAVDLSTATIQAAIDAHAQLLLVHHGMFWDGLRPVTSYRYLRIRQAIEHDLAVYASHLPLDLHPELGNNVLLAARLELTPSAGFGRYHNTEIGVAGTSDVATQNLFSRVRAFAEPLGSNVTTTPVPVERKTRSWGLLTGAGASSETLNEAAARGIDTLIVGEGPHHTAVMAGELGIAIAYAGHYASETLGIQALARELERKFALPWTFIHRPTGL